MTTDSSLLRRIALAATGLLLATLVVVAPSVEQRVAKASAVGLDDTFATFNGSNYFNANDNDTFDVTGNITVSAWIRPTSLCASSECVFVGKETNYLFAIRNGTFQYALMNSGGSIWDWRGTGGVIPVLNQWQHVSFTVARSTSDLWMYMNGRQVYSVRNATDVPNTGFNSSGAFTIGARYGGADGRFSGSIDEVRVYNTTRASAAQAQADMNTWGPANATGLVLYYDFNEGSGSTLNNRVTGASTATNITATGSPTWGAVRTQTQLIATTRIAHTFTRSYLVAAGGWTVPAGVTSANVLVVGGGGGGSDLSDGSQWSGGGGGAGGYRNVTGTSLTPGAVVTVSVGGGGHRASKSWASFVRRAENGADSVFGSIQSLGGGAGGGGSHSGWHNGATGGSGGGGGTYGGLGAAGSSGQGNAGGNAWANCCGAGGGGGAGSAGGTSTSGTGGAAGNGVSNSISGTAVLYAGGGAGHGDGAAGSAGTSGGTPVGTNGAEGVGSGGGGGKGPGGATAETAAGHGGTGVVIVSYATPCDTQQWTGAGGSTLIQYQVPSGFTSCNANFTTPANVTALDAVIVGGGGGGGGGNSSRMAPGGGGGGGQVLNLRAQNVSANTSYSIVIGGGGAGGAGSAVNATPSTAGSTGGESTAFGSTANGGAGGGGSGTVSSQLGYSGYGGNSGSGNLRGEPNWEAGGGGAGAGSPGNNAMDGAGGAYWGQGATGGYGGNGVMPGWVIGWCSGMFGGGGGGGSGGTDVVYPLPLGGAGGGGNGATNGASGPTAPTSGTNHCGAGGGGGGSTSSTHNGANGGTGVVYVRYNHAYSAESFTEGSDIAVALGTATNLGLSNVVTDYTVGETVRVRMNVTNGTLSIVSASGTTVTGNNSASVTLVGSQANINTALASATLNAATITSTQLMIDVDMNPVTQTFGGYTYTPHTNGHFYTFRSITNARVWEALDVAVRMQLGGRQGFLATPTSADEMTVMRSVAGSSSAWLGIADDFQENTFRLLGEDAWGPISTGGTAINGRYTNWASSEPNNSGGPEGNNSVGSEDFAHFNTGSASTWNDNRPFVTMNGALVEFEPKSSRIMRNVTFTGAASRTATVSAASNLGLGSSHIGASTFNSDETIVATLTAPAGTTLAATGAATITGSGTRTLTLEGTKANVNATLNNVTATAGATGDTTITVSYRAKLANNGTSSNYKYNAGTGNFYLLRSSMSFASAETDAATLRFGGVPGYVLSTTSAAEQTWLNANVSTSSFWMALNDTDNEGQWTMRTRDAFQTSGFDDVALPGGYIPWATNEPNGLRSENCHHRRMGEIFGNDVSCSTAMASVVEFRPYAVTQDVTLGVTAAPTLAAPTTGLTATVGTAYSLTLSASGGVSPYTYNVVSGTLPSGLTLSSAGVISGTATDAPQSQAITVRATDANGATGTSSSFTLTTNATTCTTATTVVGGHTVQQFTTTGFCQWQVPVGVTAIDGFVVGGGGGGGGDGGGGGGGGGYHPVNGIAVTPGDVLTIRVGAGGTAGGWGVNPTAGGASTILRGSSVLARAEGGGAGASGPGTVRSAGGTSSNGFAGGAGGISGGNGVVVYPAEGGPGSRGVSNYFLGSARSYSGGGGGGSYTQGQNYAVPAGFDGGGNGCDPGPSSNTPGVNGAVNTGGGGGAGCAGWITAGAAGGTGIAMIRYTTDPLDAFPASIGTPAYRMVAEDFQTLDSTRKQWIDSSGNGRHSVSVSGTPAIQSITGNGASSSVRALVGGTSEGVRFATFSPTTTNAYTFFYVARYSGTARQRLFDGVSLNWLSGFYAGNVGVAHHTSWLTASSNTGTTVTNWQLMTDQNTLLRQNGVNRASTANSQSFDSQLGLNAGYFGNGGGNPNERSDFNAAEVILYNGNLTTTQIRQVENYLARTYDLRGFDFNNNPLGANGPGTLTAAKTGTVSTGSTSQLALTWTAPQDTTGVSGYKVEYKKASDSTWTTFSASASGTSTTVTGLDAATSYDTRVTPVDSGAPNRPSISASATTWGTSSIALGTMPTSPAMGTNYTLTANVTGPSSTTGTVAFMENGTVISACGTTSVLSGVASCTWNPSTFGSRNITATFSGDGAYKEVSTVSATTVSVDYGACSTSSATTGRYTYLRVTQSTACKISTLPSGVESVDVLVVGGGGGGGENVGAGGSGGGGYYAERVPATSSSELVVTVGAGGRAGRYFADTGNGGDITTLRDGGNGGATSITWSTNTFTGNGGIGGQTHWSDNTCGGGTGIWNNTTTPASSGSGSGGTAFTGGTGGLDGSTTGVNASAGGNGFSNSITGVSTPYGGGGGGGAWGGGAGAAGGSGGGGAGVNTGTGVSGTANTGGGGGGGTAGCTAGGTGGSGIAIIRYANVPTISTQPSATTKASGQSHTFSVTPAATGAVGGDFTYQWRKDGTNISGATSSTYAISNLVVADAGTYSVVVKSFGTSGAVSTVTSSDAVLTMNKGTQTITFGTLADRIYGVAAFTISSTNSASLQNTFVSNDTSICTVASPTFTTNTTSAILTVVSNGTCSVTASQAGDVNYNAATSVTQTFVVTAKALTISGMTAANKEYDRSTTATLNFTNATLNGVVSGDTVTINSAGTTGAFGDKTVANGKTVTATGTLLAGAQAGRYTLAQPTATANITAKALSVTGFTANNKVYDGTTAATSLLITGTAALSGVIGADAVTLSTASAAGVFADKAIGNTKTITVSGLTISGADAANYTLTQPTTSANITARELMVSGITANNRTYDATTTATSQLVLGSAALVGRQGSDTVTFSTASATATFADKTVGTAKTVTVAGLTISGADAANYTLTQPTTTASILAKELTVTGVTASGRVYDSTTDATALLSLGSAALSGKQGSDTVVLSTASAAATFATKGIGTSKVITLTGLTISGADAANYTLTQPTTTATILAKTLTVSGITANNRVYDRTVDATSQLVLGSAALVGKQGSDTVTLSTASATATFVNRNVGIGKTVSVAGLTISGADAANYTLTQPTTTATILAKTLIVTGITANNRVYDRTVDATSQLVTTSAALSGFVLGDTPGLDLSGATAEFATKTVGTAKIVTISGLTITGTDAANYTLTQPTTTANITAKELTVTGVTASDRNYNSTTAATINTGSAAFSGIVSGDDVSIVVSGATGTFSSALFGSSKTVTIAGITASGTDASNYSITQPTTTASIAKKTLTVIGITAGSRVYNASTAATSILNLSVAELAGIEGSDSISLNTSGATGTFSDKNVGSGKNIQIAGITVAGTAASNYTLVQPTVTGAVTAKTISVTGITASNRVYNSSANATSTLDTSNAALSGVESGDSVSLSTASIAGIFANKNVGNAKAITISGITISGTGAANYSLTQPTASANVTAKTITVTGITANNRTYDATTSATALLVKGSAALSGVESGDAVTLDHSAATASFANKNVADGKIVTLAGITISGTDAANYSLTQPTTTANITAKTITVTGITANNRVYNATTAATALLIKTSAALSGVESGDSVSLNHNSATATFADKNIGTSKTITIAGITISGTDAANYSLTQPTTNANITAKTITVTGITANNRVYNASDSATALLVKGSAALFGVESGDSVNLDHSAATATFADKNVANSKTITIAGITISGTDANNYSLTQPTTTANITAKTITVTGITATNRIYDASIAATALLVKGSAALSGVESGDTVNLNHNSATATFADKNVANGKTVTIAGITISGTDAANYSLTQPATTADVTAKELTVSGITANNRTYNASTNVTAQLVLGSAALVGKQGSDVVALSTGSTTASVADKNIGVGKTVTIAGLSISGTDVGNYTLTQPTTTLSILAKGITVTGITANNRVYDASIAATALLIKGSAALSGVESGDVVTLDHSAATATFATKTVDTSKVVSLAGITISGTDANNYTLTQPTTTANITAKTITVTGITANNRVYNATTAATALLIKTSAALSGVEANDTVSLNHNSATATFADKNVGTNKTITIAGITISGTDANNYTLTQPTTTANITAKTITVTGITANNRVYNATTAATALLIKTSAALSGVEANDTVSLNHNSATATFADKNVGTNKTITIAGITISGTDANNYSLTQPTTTANITAKTITVTGITADLKIFDNTTVASVNTSSAATVGIESGDSASLNTASVSGAFADTVVANGKTVQIAGVTLTGTDAGNYTVTQPTTTADMIAASAGLAWNAPSDITYGTTLSATQLNATTNIAGTFTYTPAAGTRLTAGTHTLSVSFTPTNPAYDPDSATVSIVVNTKTLTVSGLTTSSRVYDSTTSATSQIDTSAAQLNGVLSGDAVTMSTSAIQGAYADKTVGVNKNITVSGITVAGANVNNYSLTQPSLTGTVTAKSLSVTGITANGRVYDRTTSATALLVKTSAALSGVEASDTVTLNHSAATATFANKSIGAGKVVTIAGITIGGADASNYTVTQPTTSASIWAETLTIIGITASDRIYDATTSATSLLDTTSAALSGVVTNDAVTLSTTNISGVFASASIGTNKSITISGNTISGTDAGNYVLTQPTAAADITAKELTVSGLIASNKVYDATTAATILVNTSGAQIDGVQGSDNITVNTSGLAATFGTKAVGINKTITITGITIAGANVANYTLTQPTLSANITSRTLTVNGITAVDREYDRTTAATALLQRSSAALVGIQGSDSVSLNTGNASATFANKAVGQNKPITISGVTISGTDASNYTLTQPSTSASVTAKELTISGITASNKVYDAAADATALLDTQSAALVGVISLDAVTLSTTNISGSFADKTIGLNKLITIAGNTISGGDASNYTLTQPTTDADITAKTLTITGLTASDKVYDASTSATALVNKTNAALSGVISGDIVSLSTDQLAANFATKSVANNRTVTTSGNAISGTDAGNYSLTQPSVIASITAKPLTVTGITANNRVYDSTTSATALLVKGAAALSGVVGGDTVTLDHSSATATFATKIIGSNKTVTIAGITIGGIDAGNYALSQPSTIASITARNLAVTGITANDRIYNGNSSATALLVKSSAALSGIQGSDNVTLDHSSATASFANKNIGPSKTITIEGITIGGSDASNYTLTQPSTTASVTAKTLTVTGITANNRVYDSTTDAFNVLNTGSAALSGVVSGDSVSLSVAGINGTFATKAVGPNKAITITGITIGSTDADNYSLTQPTTTASITAKSLTVSGVVANNKVYNGTTVAPVDTTNAAFVGIQGNDAVTLDTSSISGTFANPNVNTGITVAIAGTTATGTDASNYTVTQPSSSADITQASAGLTWSNPADAVFGASLSATQLNATASVNGIFTYSPSAGTRLNVGTHTLGVTFTPDSGNYAVAQRTVTFVVTRKSLTVAAVASTITFGAPVVSTYTVSGLEGSDSDSGVTYTYAGTGSTTYAGSQTAPVNAGTYSVTPSAVTLSSGLTSNYSITHTAANLTINKATQAAITAVPSVSTVTYQPTPNEPTISLSSLGGSGTGTVSYAVTSTGGICSISGATLTALLAGTCTVVATKAESANFVSRDSAAITITVNKSTQELSLDSIANKTYGDANFSVTSSATSGLAITLSASPANVCEVPSGLTVRIVSNGTCTITASQSGDSNYLPATVASGSADSRSFTIATKNLTISGTTALNRIYDGTRNATAQLSFTSSSLVGVVSGDTVTADYSAATGTFATKNVGANKAITVAGIAIGGTHASRYNISMPTTLVANVTQKTVTVDGITVPTRAFNTTVAAVLSTGAYNFTGIEGSDTVTLDDSAYTATYATPGVGALKIVTISDLALAGVDAQNYALTQPTLQGDIVKAAATIAFASTRSATYDGTPRPLATSTTPAALSVIPSYTGTGSTSYGPSASSPTNAGGYSLVATINDVNYEGSNTSAWTINKFTATVTATQSSLMKTFNGATHVVPVSTSPSGRNITINYTGINGTVYNSSFAPTNAGTYRVTGTVVEANFDGFTEEILTVAKAAQSAITFVSESAATYGTPHRLIAVGGAGSGTLTFVRDGGPCTVNASTGVVTPTGTRQCAFRAERASSSNYLAASSNSHTISVAKGSQSLSFTSIVPSTTAKDSTYVPTASATSGLTPVISIALGSGSVCTLNNTTVTFLGSGTCEISASQPGDSNWLAAASIKQIVEVGKLSQAISFPQPANYELGNPDFVLEASASSGLPVTSTVISGGSVCSVSNIGIVSILAVGSCTIEVSQAGDSVFSAASPISRTIIVQPALPSAPHIASISAGDGSVTVGYIAPSTNGGSALVSYSVIATSLTAPTISNTNCSTSTLSCTLVGLVNGSSYNINVKAFNSRGGGEVSESAEVLVPAPTLLAVQNVSGTRSNTTLDVSWMDPNTYGDGTFVQYDVSLRERGGSFGSPVRVQSESARSTSVNTSINAESPSSQAFGVVRSLTTIARSARFTNLDPSKLYETKIVTITSSATIETSTNTASVMVMPLGIPSAPRDLNVEAPTAATARVTWATPRTDGGSALQSYTVSSSIGQCQPSSNLATSCAVSNLQSGDSLTITVRASNAIGNSVAASTTYVVPSAPGAPSIGVISVSTTAATINWRAPQSNGGRAITSYSVAASETQNPSNAFRCTSSGLSCVINGLKPAVNYTFKVRATNSVGAGAYSAAAAFDMARPASSDWTSYRNSGDAVAINSALSLPPAPARVTKQSVSGGRRTQVTAVRAAKDANIPVTHALISIRTRTNKLLARIKVLVDPANPTTSVSVPFASSKVRVSVQFANDIGISSGGPAGVNIAEGNTLEWTTVSNEARIKGTEVPGNLSFARGKSTVTPAMQKTLKKMAAAAKSRGGLIYVSGFAQKGEIKSAWMLEPLARARAEAVAKYLAKIGVRQWITFHGSTSAAVKGWQPVTGRQVVITTVMPNEI